MNKKLFLFFLLIVLFLSLGTLVYASDYRSEVKVGLKYGSGSGNSVTVSSPIGLTVFDATVGTILYTSQPQEEVFIQMGSTGFAAFDKFDASSITKISVQVEQGGVIACDGKTYRGYIYIERTEAGELLVINYVGTDDYVTSVLGKEMSYTWPIEALKAQAVCARNFVLCRGNAHQSYGFDVCPTTHCQVYGGVSSEHANTRQAVEETKGILATHKGEIVALYFFATSGGQTENVENVWGSAYDYLRSVPDTYENPDKASRYNWTTTVTRDAVEAKLLSAGVDIGTLEEIIIDEITETGRVTKMTFYGSKDSYTVKRETCRTILGLYSQKFSVSPDIELSLETTSGAAGSPFYAISANGIEELSGYSALSGDTGVCEIDMDLKGAESYTINGGGFGHGVGMSQWGARGMAENGFTYDQILHHYFTDIELG